MGRGDKTMATHVRELQQQSNRSPPHQHAECAVVGAGQGADSADAWIMATTQADLTLRIELRSSPGGVPAELAPWIYDYFERLLSMLPRSWKRGTRDIHEELLHMAGPKPFSPI